VFCRGSEHNGVGTERYDDCALLQVLPATAESSCATTKAVEVCVNGVKQVIIVPLALSSDNVTTVSSTAFMSGSLTSSSLSPVISNIDNRPDDVKLLAESCFQMTSSSISSFGKPALFSTVTNGCTNVSAGYTNHTVPPFSVGRMSFANSPAELPQNQYAAAASQFHVNSVSNRPTLPSTIIPYLSPSFPAHPSLSTSMLPMNVFPPAQQSSSTPQQHPFMFSPGINTVPPFDMNSISDKVTLPSTVIPHPSPSFPSVPSLSTPVLPMNVFPQQSSNNPRQQPFMFSPDVNNLLPFQIQPDLNCLQHLLPSTVSQSPWTSFHPLQMRPTYGRTTAAMDTAINNYTQPGPTIAAHQSTFDLSLTNHCGTDYRNFLPSLQRAVTPDFPVNDPSIHIQQYLLRKRGMLPQNSAQGMQLDVGNYRMPQFDPRLLASAGMPFQRPPPFNTNEVQSNYPDPSSAFTGSHFSQFNTNSGTSLKRKGVRKHAAVRKSHKNSVTNNIVHPMLSVSQGTVPLGSADACREPLQPLNSSILHHVTSTVCKSAGSNAASMIPNKSELLQNNVNTSGCRPVAAVPNDLQVTMNLTRPASPPVMTVAATVATCVTETANLSVPPQIIISTSYCQPVSGISTDLQVTENQTQPTSVTVVATATSSEPTVTTYVTETTCHSTAMLDTLLFNVRSEPTARSVPSSCSLTSNPSLSNLLATDLFPLNSVSVADSSHFVTASDTVQRSDANLEIDNCQLGTGIDSSIDVGSLPADVMGETAESESLLMSFCSMFEQSNAADQQHSAEVPSLLMSDGINDSLKNSEQQKDSSVSDYRPNAEARGLQIAKSLGKGRHFAEEMQQRRQERAGKKRRRMRLTSLEVADESNSSDSWHPDSHSESSEYQTPSSPTPSPVSSVSRSSDDFVVTTQKTKRQRMILSKQKRSSLRTDPKWEKAAVHKSPRAVTQKCTVVLERLQLEGQHSVNVRLAGSLVCCPLRNSIKPTRRIASSDSDSSATDWQPTQKL